MNAVALPTYECIRLDRDGPLTWLTLNRPDKMNAMNATLLGEFDAALEALKADTATRVIAIRGAGRAFSAGFDIQRPSGAAARHLDIVEDYDRLEGNVKRFFRVWDHPKPVIASIHGYCLAGASQLATCCDLTLVAEDATIGLPTIPVGGGYISPMWVHLVGPKRAKQMSFVAGSKIDGTTAEAWGWANEAVPAAQLEQRTRELAHEIAKIPAPILRMKKMSINRVVDAMGFRATALMGAETDALLHYSAAVQELTGMIREVGLKETITRFQAGETGKDAPEHDPAEEY